MNIVKHNSAAWDKQVSQGNKWTVPVSAREIEDAKNGKAKFLLTPTKLVPQSWYGDVKGKNILCLASGGGQQGPLFAAMGANVTVFDNSPAQLEKDIFVASRENLNIKTVQGDMRDLSAFADGEFDLIFHPVSNCFVDDILPVWKECYRVLKRGGVMLAAFANPISYIFDFKHWDNTKELVVRYKVPYSDTKQLPKHELEDKINNCEPLDHGHTLEDQIAGQLNAGFVLTGLYEDGSGGDLLDPYIEAYIATKAEKH
ncbi:SAM-dependent methyltransferase [Elusimicrobium simillimum]|uniref:class I SAM-dependent methyltransferase n=1 Tax=Elusimicrobium simillimum TaxID=3143438 RepID=UPI003C6F9D31